MHVRRSPTPGESAALPPPADSGLDQLGQVVESDRRLRVAWPKDASLMAMARRISGSASASRFVAWSNWAKLSRATAVSGRSGPKDASLTAMARRISGSASASHSSPGATGAIAESDRRSGGLGRRCLVDGDGPVNQRLCLASPFAASRNWANSSRATAVQADRRHRTPRRWPVSPHEWLGQTKLRLLL